MPSVESILYLSVSDIGRCMPGIAAQLELVAQAFTLLAGDQVEMPPKIGVHPRPSALLEAMPAWLPSRGVVGLKWISGYPGNRARGRDQIQGLIVLNDPDTGTPLCVMDARQITAARTAAVSAYAVHLLLGSEPVRSVGLLGAGAQAKAHLAALGQLGIAGELRVYDAHQDRAKDLAAWAVENGLSRTAAGVATVSDAVGSSDLLLSCASLGAQRQVLGTRDVEGVRLIVAIDDDVYVSSEIVADCVLFTVDDRSQFAAFRSRGDFAGYRDPEASLAEVAAGLSVPTDGLLVFTALGVGVADLVFAAAVLDAARVSGVGTRLPS